MPAAVEVSTVAVAGAGAGAGADMVGGENRADGRSICEMEFVVGVHKAEVTKRRRTRAFLELL